MNQTIEQMLGLGSGTRIVSEETVRHFVACQECKSKMAIDYIHATTEQKWHGCTLVGTTIYRIDGDRVIKQHVDPLCKQCQNCKSWSVKHKRLRHHCLKPENQHGSRCEMATGEHCECSCDGERHGIAYLYQGKTP